jgi:hypothetical protein
VKRQEGMILKSFSLLFAQITMKFICIVAILIMAIVVSSVPTEYTDHKLARSRHYKDVPYLSGLEFLTIHCANPKNGCTILNEVSSEQQSETCSNRMEIINVPDEQKSRSIGTQTDDQEPRVLAPRARGRTRMFVKMLKVCGITVGVVSTALLASLLIHIDHQDRRRSYRVVNGY